MKRMICLLLALLTLSGCALLEPAAPAAPTVPTSTPIQTTAPSTAAATTPAPPVITVHFTRQIGENLEYALITAVDQLGETVWEIETDRYDQAQLDRVSEIGQWQHQYYFVDDGDIVALDVLTGSELWRNPDFAGNPAGPDACHIAADGAVYLCGFFGPDFYAVSAQGTTITRIAELDPDYYWAHKLIVEEGKILVCLSGGPEGDMGPEAYKIEVPME